MCDSYVSWFVIYLQFLMCSYKPQVLSRVRLEKEERLGRVARYSK